MSLMSRRGVRIGLEGSAGALGPLLQRRLRAERRWQPSCDMDEGASAGAPVTVSTYLVYDKMDCDTRSPQPYILHVTGRIQKSKIYDSLAS